MLPAITRLLVELTGATGVLARNDPRVRELEGLERKVELLDGAVPDSIEVREGTVRFAVDPWKGQKTGAFLDQRENHAKKDLVGIAPVNHSRFFQLCGNLGDESV